MFKRLSFLAYSDIHHHQWDNGLTEADVLALEDEICVLSDERGADFTLFVGDRFLWRNPISHVRAAADGKIKAHLEKRPYLAVIGNHDREAKNAHSGHSMMHLPDLLGPTAKNLTIAAEAGLYKLPALPDVDFWICPAGQSSVFQPQRTGAMFTIGLFHDIMYGVDLGMGHRSDFGVPAEMFDKDFFDVVIAGDNHVHQKLPLNKTTGYYCGAPCQHNWGDVDQSRGFLYVELEHGKPPRVEHIQSRAPHFIKYERTITRPQQADFDTFQAEGNIVQCILRGDISVLSKVDTAALEKKLRASSGARQLTVTTDPTITFQAMIPELQHSKSPSEDWSAYVSSGKLDVQGAPMARVAQLGHEILHEAKDS